VASWKAIKRDDQLKLLCAASALDTSASSPLRVQQPKPHSRAVAGDRAKHQQMSYGRECVRNSRAEPFVCNSYASAPAMTPRTTIEAIMCCVRQRGSQALHEPANIERLSRCDDAAIAEIDARITKLQGSRYAP
jgi:hypothetical protein